MKKVLIVDDQREIRKLMRQTLTRRYVTLEADNGDDAWQQVLEHQPDAVLLDVMMPGQLNGLEVCARIKSSPQHQSIHVALITALGSPQDLARARELGADACFVKPFSPLAVVQHLENVL